MMERRGYGRVALRNAGLLVVQRGGLLIAGLGFAALVPRSLGPELYGRYALVAALAVVIAACSTLGVTETIGRHGPALAGGRDHAALQRLFGSVLTLRLASGLSAAVVYIAVTSWWLRDLDQMALGAAAAAVLARAIWLALFALFLGLNQAAWWGVGELINRWAVLVFVFLGVLAGGFRGACAGLLVSEAVVLAIGLWWTRDYLSLRRPDWRYLSPFLRVGLTFFGSNLLSIALQGSGEVLIRGITGDYAEVSYYGVANGAFLSGTAAIQQLSLAFVAALVMLRNEGESALLDDATRRLMTWLAAGIMAVVFATLFLGPDLVPLVVGRAYRPVSVNLVPAALTLLVQALCSGVSVFLLAHDRGRVVLVGSGLRLAAFWIVGPLLIAWRGSLGAWIAMLAAFVLQAVYLGWRVRGEIPRALRAWCAAAALGMPFVALLWLRGPVWVNVVMWLGACGAYLVALAAFGVVRRGELAATWSALGLTRGAARTPSRAPDR
ncbi:MAG TPA: oligosaccharide flippase family protein [Methylomirabilota bacterium]|nr:oligosaccharide flippase family protein [Methylomirabilota bacterium]